MTVALEPAARSWSYVGAIKPRYQSELAFRVGGKLAQRLVEVGDRVKKDQVLARLDPVDLELALAAQKAELAAAQTSKNETTAALSRYQSLLEGGHVSTAALEQRQSAAAEARSRVERAERAVDLARNQLTYATLAANADGVVTAVPVEVGQVVTAGQLIAKVARLDAVEVEVALPEQQVEAAKTAAAETEIWGGGDVRLPAHLREVAPDADPVSRTFRARFAIERSADIATLGRTATVHLRAPGAERFIALPLSALSGDGKATFVWVVNVDGTRAAPRAVTVARLEKDRALVSGGLSPGERIVALGVHMLDPDKPIRPVETRTSLNRN